MPIVKINRKLVYFAHVPKCAGTAVEHYLTAAFGPLAFHDPRHNTAPDQNGWTRSSPQHVTKAALARLFADSFFDETFAIVRSPVTRLLSSYQFLRDIEGIIAPDMPFVDWLDRVIKHQPTSPWQFDNHTRPMDDIVPKNARIFHLEDGLDSVAAWLQTLTDTPLPPTITVRNVLKDRLAFENKPVRSVVAAKDEIAMIANFHAADFERFRYAPLTGEMLP